MIVVLVNILEAFTLKILFHSLQYFVSHSFVSIVFLKFLKVHVKRKYNNICIFLSSQYLLGLSQTRIENLLTALIYWK